jgi:hypothetical protein
MSTIEWQGRDGKTALKLVVREYCSQAIIESYMNGKYDFSGDLHFLNDQEKRRAPAGTVASIGHVALQQDRADQVAAMVAKLQAEIDARPEVILGKLISQRQALAAQIGYVLDARHEDHQRRVERMSATGVGRKAKRDYEAEEAEARTKLAEFDSAHPEIIEEINRRKQADIARFLAID